MDHQRPPDSDGHDDDSLKRVKHGAFVFIDCETTGLPLCRDALYTDTEVWPRVVSFAFIIADSDAGIRAHGYSLIRPVGFSIPAAATHIHEITTAYAQRHGRDLREVMLEFLGQLRAHTPGLVVAHNIDFDVPIVAAESHRLGLPVPLVRLRRYCTMKSTTGLVRIPRTRNSYKWPRLTELYWHLFGRPHESAHNSLGDVAATLECYCELSAMGFIRHAARLPRPKNMHALGLQAERI
jgi:DNA polymerase III epsilon subunit-like protein